MAKRGFLVCPLPDVFDMDASSVSALQHSRNIPFAGHFSANAMPDRPSVLSSACGGYPGAGHEGRTNMRISHQFRAGLIGLIAIVGASVSSAAYADSGTILIRVFKAGWFIGGSGGSGTLIFHGRRYPLSIGGRCAGPAFCSFGRPFVGTVCTTFRP